MPDSLRLLLADARYPSGDPADAGGVEAAVAGGLVTDRSSLRSFLHGRLWTAGAIDAVTAAVVCARVSATGADLPLYRSVEAELDARIPSPVAREASRRKGAQLLRLAMTMAHSAHLDLLARSSVTHGQRPHHPVVLGTVAAAAGASPEEAAEAAAYASIAGAAFAAEGLLAGGTATTAGLVGGELATEVVRVAREAATASVLPLSQIPSLSAPALDYLLECTPLPPEPPTSRAAQPVPVPR